MNLPARAITEHRAKVRFFEDFNAPIDSSVWSMYGGAGFHGNGTRDPAAITVSNSCVVITAQMVSGSLQSGGMAHRVNYTYGRFEFKVKADNDPNAVMSAVVLTWPQSENWPTDGENDIFETGATTSRNPFYSHIHYPDGSTNGLEIPFAYGADGSAWHIMAMEWGPDQIRLYRDGVLSGIVNDPAVIPSVPHHICIQMDAYGSSMTGSVNMYVDWVKISDYTPLPKALVQAAAAFTDDFTTLQPGIWSATNGSPIVSVGRLRMPTTLSYSGLVSVHPVNLTGSSIATTIITTPTGGSSIQVGFDLQQPGGYSAIGIYLSGGTLYCQSKVDGTSNDTSVTTSDTHWRIRESSGTIYWETSADGTAWTQRRSQSNPFTVTSLFIEYWSGYYNSGDTPSPAYAEFDNQNL